jgi:excisionase family DNA binding protein
MTHEELIADGLVSPDEAMRFLGISRPTLNRLLDRGVLPTVRLVTTRRIPRRALVDLAARSVVMPGAPAAKD